MIGNYPMVNPFLNIYSDNRVIVIFFSGLMDSHLVWGKGEERITQKKR